MMSVSTIKPQSVLGYLQLMRPANIVTAWADILLGYAAANMVTEEINNLDLAG